MNVQKPAISSVHALRAPGAKLGSQQKRYGPGYGEFGQSGYINGARGETFVRTRSNASIQTPQTGGVGSQSRNPVGVSGGIPGSFGAGGGLTGASGAPQVGGGDIAKSTGGAQSPSKTTGTQTNPYGKTTPPGQSSKDALTKALLQKILSDRKEGEKAVQRNPETKKISEVDRSKAEFDEKTQAAVNKLAETFKKDSVELEKSIKGFQERFAKQLEETSKLEKENKVPEEKQLNNILDDLVKFSKNDKYDAEGKAVGNEAGTDKFNPQNFMDAADRLDNWLGEESNQTEAKDRGYLEDLTQINDKAQSIKATAEEEIAYYENNPNTVLRTSDRAAENANDEATRLQDNLKTNSTDLSEEDKAKVEDFNTKLEDSMKQINPEEGEGFDTKASTESLAELKKSFNELPEAVKNNPEVQESFKEVSDFGRVSVEGQELARKMEPDSAKYEQAATEYVQGADKLDATTTEHRTEKEREEDIRYAVDDNQLVDKFIADEKTEAQEQGSDIDSTQPETSSPEAQRIDNLGAGFESDEDAFGEDQFSAIDAVGQEDEAARSIEDSIDFEIEDTGSDAAVDDILNDITEEVDQAEEIELEEDISEDIDEILEE